MLLVVAPTVAEYVPDPHAVHVPFPLAVLYVPAAHATQDAPFCVYPAAHRVQTVAPLELVV